MGLAMPCEISLLSHRLLICQILPKTQCRVEIHSHCLKMQKPAWICHFLTVKHFNSNVLKHVIMARSDINYHSSWVNGGLTSCTQLTSMQGNATLCLLGCDCVKCANPNKKVFKLTEKLMHQLNPQKLNLSTKKHVWVRSLILLRFHSSNFCSIDTSCPHSSSIIESL